MLLLDRLVCEREENVFALENGDKAKQLAGGEWQM